MLSRAITSLTASTESPKLTQAQTSLTALGSARVVGPRGKPSGRRASGAGHPGRAIGGSRCPDGIGGAVGAGTESNAGGRLQARLEATQIEDGCDTL
jgi:hypothetical protein